MTDDRTRRSILARRARFVAAALTAVGVGACSGEDEPQVCLTPLGDASADTADSGPSVCLTPEPPDTGFDAASSDATSSDAASSDATSEDAAPEDTGPTPCLAPPLDGG